MTIIECYRNALASKRTIQDDFLLYTFRDSFFLGFDEKGDICAVIMSSSTSCTPILQRTKLLSVECNIRLDYSLDGIERKNDLVHIIRCFSPIEKEREMFLEIIDTMIPTVKVKDDEVMLVFRTLSKFFSDKTEPSDSELIGLYAEIDAIISFSSDLDLGKYWQSKDRLKFDFSLSDKFKLEVKATTNNFRAHHFRHEQLNTEIFDIYILSYMLRYDDEGKSLFDLLHEVKPLIKTNHKKITRINLILKNVSEERLRAIRFSPEYTSNKRHVYDARIIPKFPDGSPEGVANAEYDCSLENIDFINDDAFVIKAKEAIKEDLADAEV